MKGLASWRASPTSIPRAWPAGASYGGYMIYWIAGHQPLQDAGVARRRLQSGQHGGHTEELWFMDWEFGATPYPTAR